MNTIKAYFLKTTNIKRQASAHIPTRLGDFDLIAYAADEQEPMPHLAIVSKKATNIDALPVRIHSECMTGDVFGSRRCECGEQLAAALQYITEHGGAVLYLRQEGRGIGLINKLKAYNLQDKGFNTAEANAHLGLAIDGRTYEAAEYILKDLKINKIKLLTNNPLKLAAFEQSDIEVVERIPVLIEAHKDNIDYLITKQELMGHILGL